MGYTGKLWHSCFLLLGKMHVLEYLKWSAASNAHSMWDPCYVLGVLPVMVLLQLQTSQSSTFSGLIQRLIWCLLKVTPQSVNLCTQ